MRARLTIADITATVIAIAPIDGISGATGAIIELGLADERAIPRPSAIANG